MCWRILSGACLLRAYASLARCWIVVLVVELTAPCPIALLGVVHISPRIPTVRDVLFRPALVIFIALAYIIVVFLTASPRIVVVTEAIFLTGSYKYKSEFGICSDAFVN